MTDIIITKEDKTKDHHGVEMICGKTTARFWLNEKLGYLNVLCQNASHKAWRGNGKYFWGADRWDQAFKHYRSAAMVSMLNHAKELMGA